MAADEQGLAFNDSVGEPLPADDLRLWVEGFAMMLVELFDTGGLRWGRRVTLSDGTGSDHVVMLGDRIADEPDPSSGGHLRDVGLDVQPGWTAHVDGRLIQWLQLYLDDSREAPPARQLVVAWRAESETVGLLEHLECKPDAPEGAIEDLVLAGVHAAADVP
ncbi:MAG: hypothetical protein EA387_16595 [Nitriliruptor sp.]|nr:MAG: hypothetical protein EA387_16595 [Nitriliruptor sp.]